MTTPASPDSLKNLTPSEAIDLFVREYSSRASSKAAQDFLKSLTDHIPRDHPDRARLKALERLYAVRLGEMFRRKEGKNGDSSPPSGFAWTPAGELVVADDFNHRIQIYDKDRKLKLCFGEKGKNPGQFMYPRGIAVDPDGNIYVADAWNHRVQKFDAHGKHLLSFGIYGEGKGELNEPYDVLIDGEGRVIVVERYNHRLHLFKADGTPVGSIGNRGSVLEERLAYIHETPLELFPLPAFELPTSIAQDRLGNFYIADSGNHRVLKFDAEWNPVLTVGEKGKGCGQFLYPVSICTGPNDILYVADLNNNRVQAFTPHGQCLFAIDEGPDGVEFKTPSLISVDPSGKLYVGLTFDSVIAVFETPTAPMEDVYKDLAEIHPQDFRVFYGQGWRHEEQGSADGARDAYLTSFALLLGGKDSVVDNPSASGFEEALNLPIRYARLTACSKDKEYSEPLLLKCLDFHDRLIEEFCKKILNKKAKWDAVAMTFSQKLAEDEKHILQGTDDPLVFNKDFYLAEKEDKALYREIRISLHFFRVVVKQRAAFLRILLNYDLSPESLSAFLETLKTRYRAVCKHLLSLMDEKAKNEESMLKDFGGIVDDRDKFGAFRSRLFANYRIKDMLFHFQFELRSNLQALKQAAFKYKTSYAEAGLHDLFLAQPDAALLPKILLGLHENWSPLSELEADYFDILDSWIALNRMPTAIRRMAKDDLAPVPFDLEDFNAEEHLRTLLVEGAPLEKTADGIACGNEIYPPDAGRGEALEAAIHAVFDTLAVFEQKTQEIFKEVESSILKRHELNVKAKKANPLDKKEPIHLTMNICILDFQIALLRRIVKTLGINEISNVTRLIVGGALLSGGNPAISAQTRELFDKLQAYREAMWKKSGDLMAQRKALFYEKASLDVRLLSDLSSFGPSAINQVDQVKNRLVEVNVALDQAEVNLIRCARAKNLLDKLFDFKSAMEGGSPSSAANIMKFQYSFGGGGSEAGNFTYPIGIAHTSEGEILVVDHNKHSVQKFSRDGIFLFGFGRMGKVPGAFTSPVDIKTDRQGNIYVSDKFNNRIQKFSADGRLLASFGDVGKPETRLGAIFGISVDSEDNVWVADGQNHCIKVFSSAGEFLRTFGAKGESSRDMLEPVGICCADNGDFFVGDKSGFLLKRFNRKGELLQAIEKNPGDGEVYTIIHNPRYGVFAADAWKYKIYRFTPGLEPISTYSVCGIRAGQFGIVSGLSIHQDLLAVTDLDKKRIQVFRLR